MTDQKPGRYDAPEGYKGFIQFPAPLKLTQFNKVWSEIIEPLGDKTALELDRFNYAWQAARLLILDYGKWAVDGVAPGQAKDDDLDIELSSWAGDKFEEYVFPKLPARRRRALTAL